MTFSMSFPRIVLQTLKSMMLNVLNCTLYVRPDRPRGMKRGLLSMISTLMELISLVSSCRAIDMSGRFSPARFIVTGTSTTPKIRYCLKIRVMIISPEAHKLREKMRYLFSADN